MLATLGALALVPSTALAQAPKPTPRSAGAPTSVSTSTNPSANPAPTTRAAGYDEKHIDGDQVVTFTEADDLTAPGNGAYGDLIRRPPGVTRAGLIRPRLNFVPELLKSVENL